MNITTFLNHYQITENPFHDEEARHDSVFNRIETACFHPDFEKIMGDVANPSSAIVFGERGTGKTAIRLQIQDQIARHNRDHPHDRCMVLAYDELNPILDRYTRHQRGAKSDALNDWRLADHIDGMMSVVVPHVVDAVLSTHRADDAIDLGEQAARTLRKQDSSVKHDLMTLQMAYDRADDADDRTQRLRKAIRFKAYNAGRMFRWIGVIAAIFALVLTGYFLLNQPQQHVWLWYGTLGLMTVLALIMFGRSMWLWWTAHRHAHEMARQLRVIDRPAQSYRRSMASVSSNPSAVHGLPRTGEDDLRFAMFGRLLNVLRPFGYRSLIVVVDRVDEPTLVNGDPARMRSIVWPLLNNKFLQQHHVGVKLLLPIELRFELQRESAEFFRQARLDKQNLIERLSWTGAVLYDLCTARLNACRRSDAPPMSLRDLFEARVTSQELIDALDQMQQPRDAFKFVYAVIQEHCSNTPDEHVQFEISKPVLDAVRKQQVERVSGMLRGVRAG